MIREYVKALKMVGALILFCVAVALGLSQLAANPTPSQKVDAGDVVFDESICTSEEPSETCDTSDETFE